MEDYVIAILLLIFIILVIKYSTSKSTYYPSTPQADYTPSFYNIGSDISVADLTNTARVLPGNTGDNLLGRLQLNSIVWPSNAGTVTINGTTVNVNTIWGWRKELKVGGGGAVWYLLGPASATNNPTSLSAPLDPTHTPNIIDNFIDTTVTPNVTYLSLIHI